MATLGVAGGAIALFWPVHRSVGMELAVTGDHIVTTAARVSCRAPSTSPPHGVFRDRTTDLCTRVTEQRLAIGGAVLVVTAIFTLILVTWSKRRRPATGAARATAMVGRVMLALGLVGIAFGGATLVFLGSVEAQLHVDLETALSGSPSVQVITGVEVVGRPLGNDQTTPWRHELFVAVQPRVDGAQPDPREVLETYLRDRGASTAPVVKEFDDGWVDERGSIGADFVEFGTLEHFINTGAPGLSDYEDAATVLTARLGPEPPATFVLRIYPDARPGNDNR